MFTPMRQVNKSVGGTTMVVTGNVFSSSDLNVSSLVGTYTYQQSSIDATLSETRNVFDGWIVFDGESDKIHIEWYGKNGSEGTGAVLGGSGFYARASGSVEITQLPSLSGYEVRLVLYV